MTKRLLYFTIVCWLQVAFLSKASAQVDGYVGEIRLYAGKFAPNGWAICNGRTLQIERFRALYTIIGTKYGGDGQTTFALPDLRGRMPMGAGTDFTGHTFTLGQKLGTPTIMLEPNQLQEAYIVNVERSPSSIFSAGSSANQLTSSSNEIRFIGVTRTTDYSTLTSKTVGNLPNKTAQKPVDILPPQLVMNYIICINGILPVRD